MAPQTALLLNQIEFELRQLQLWSDTAPDSTALASKLPFCCDTLSLQQWLQFVFLPRMRALIDAKLPLPTSLCICPIAEEAFAPISSEKLLLINKIADLDELLSGKRVQQSARV
jgi:uncharacterized protein YqcC (DUF446 family)